MEMADDELVIIDETVMADWRVGRRGVQDNQDSNSQLGDNKYARGHMARGMGSDFIPVSAVQSECPGAIRRSRHIDGMEQPGAKYDLLRIHQTDVANLRNGHIVCYCGCHQIAGRHLAL